ncbi:MAG: hypothetical protein HY696_04690 [Deltaproteobacteria bacterium]|nr:hypothetical protein [Deltaproteobacteria bacterium]
MALRKPAATAAGTAPQRSVLSDAQRTTIARARVALRREATYLKAHPIVPVQVALPPPTLRGTPYNDRRGEWPSNYYLMRTPFGALHAAVARHAAQAAPPVRALAIGAGHGIAELGLRRRFGVAVHLTQIGPEYSTAPHMAEVFDATLPIPDTGAASPYSLADALASAGDLRPFDLIWSIYGNLHDAGDQLAIIRRVVERLRVGGEFFLMWDIRSHIHPQTRWHFDTIRHTAAFFRARGLDIVATDDHDRSTEAYVWGRKLALHVPFDAIWQDAAMTTTIKTKSGQEFKSPSICEIMDRWGSELGFLERFIGRDGRRYDLRPTIRLSPDTEPIRLHLAGLEEATRLMMADLFACYGVRAEQMANICIGPGNASEDKSLDEVVHYCLAPSELSDLEAGLPLSTLLIRSLSYAAAQQLLNVGFNCPFTLPTAAPSSTTSTTARTGGPRIFW